MDDRKSFFLSSAQITSNMHTFSHPLNPKSEISGTFLGRAVGLKRTGVNFAKIAPGKESFIYHSHYCEEEWIYILSGHGVADIDGEEFAVNPGDFMGFPTPSVAHHLRNTSDLDLVYLMGGENLDVEIAEFPNLGKRMLRRGDSVEIYGLDKAKPFETKNKFVSP
jgi:uncharacterized cupin superfamily protein